MKKEKMHAIYGDNILKLVEKVNQAGITKESIITVLNLGEQVVIIYYGE